MDAGERRAAEHDPTLSDVLAGRLAPEDAVRVIGSGREGFAFRDGLVVRCSVRPMPSGAVLASRSFSLNVIADAVRGEETSSMKRVAGRRWPVPAT